MTNSGNCRRVLDEFDLFGRGVDICVGLSDPTVS